MNYQPKVRSLSGRPKISVVLSAADRRGLIRGLFVLAIGVVLAPSSSQAAGIEYPDVGTISVGRGGAWVADPANGLAFQYNPAGLAKQRGLRLEAHSQLAWQGLEFVPAACPDPTAPCAGLTGRARNEGKPYLAPYGSISYGFGEIGPMSDFTVLLGLTGPAAIGKLSYPETGPQRYHLVDTNYLIAYGSLAVAASFFDDLLSVGLTGQLVKANAKFRKALGAGPTPGTDPAFDALATVDVSSGLIPTGVLGLTLRPLTGLAIGASFRPRYQIEGDGTLTTVLPTFAQDLGVQQIGEDAKLVIDFPDVLRVGVQYFITSAFDLEANVVWERWSALESIDILPQGIDIEAASLGTQRTVPDIILSKNFRDAYSFRLGGDYRLIENRFTVRAGFLHQTSAIPRRSTSVDFGNYGRNAVSAGGSVRLYGVWLDVAYAHHFIPERTIAQSTETQVATPCLLPGCTDPEPVVVGNGTYNSSLDLVSVSIRVPIDDISGAL